VQERTQIGETLNMNTQGTKLARFKRGNGIGTLFLCHLIKKTAPVSETSLLKKPTTIGNFQDNILR
jgi:hypothetical protein